MFKFNVQKNITVNHFQQFSKIFNITFATYINHVPGGGALVFEVGYHPRKQIHVIRVVFQDKAMYARTSFRGAKTCKIGKKGVFLAILTSFEKGIAHDGQIKKNTCKNTYLLFRDLEPLF